MTVLDINEEIQFRNRVQRSKHFKRWGGRRPTLKHEILVLNIETLFQPHRKRGQRIITQVCISVKEVISNHHDLAANPHFYSWCASHLWVSHWPWRTGVLAGKRRRLWRWRGARWWDTPARSPSLSRRTRTNAWGKRKQQWIGWSRQEIDACSHP